VVIKEKLVQQCIFESLNIWRRYGNTQPDFWTQDPKIHTTQKSSQTKIVSRTVFINDHTCQW